MTESNSIGGTEANCAISGRNCTRARGIDLVAGGQREAASRGREIQCVAL